MHKLHMYVHKRPAINNARAAASTKKKEETHGRTSHIECGGLCFADADAGDEEPIALSASTLW
jgi:hypothetical protein